jgi:phosphoglycolate phosphatase-like HAD superfamily hydrolase
MPFDAAIFDFDGTLVDSTKAKRDAFFAVFPDMLPYRTIVNRVLNEDPDGSRHRVIPRMIERMQDAGLDPDHELLADDLIARYGAVSEAAVKHAPEFQGASALLAALSPHMQLHLCSNTPRVTVRAHVAARGWTSYFATVEGHPAVKATEVERVIRDGDFKPQRVAVIGDGVSDQDAARASGCRFIAIKSPADLAGVGRILGV